jgi:hypothetical protein
MSGDSCPTTVPPETSCQGKNQPEPPSAAWRTDVAESTDAAAATPTFTQTQVSDAGVAVHYGEICNLGIHCDGSSTGNRSMFENNTVFLGAGGGRVAAWDLVPTGIRAGYPSPRLLRSLPPRTRARISGRVILRLTASPYYALRGVRPGATLRAARTSSRRWTAGWHTSRGRRPRSWSSRGTRRPCPG